MAAGNIGFPVALTVASFNLIVAWMVMSFACDVNDICDLESDKIAYPDKPLPSGKVKVGTAKVIAFSFFITSLFLGYLVSTVASRQLYMYLVIAGLAIALIYSVEPIRMKKRNFLGNMTFASSLSLVLLGSYVLAVGSITLRVVVVFFLAFIMLSFATIAKDLPHVEADAKTGVKTLPVVIGAEKAGKVAFSGILASSALVPLFIWFKTLPSSSILSIAYMAICAAPLYKGLVKLRVISIKNTVKRLAIGWVNTNIHPPSHCWFCFFK